MSNLTLWILILGIGAIVFLVTIIKRMTSTSNIRGIKILEIVSLVIFAPFFYLWILLKFPYIANFQIPENFKFLIPLIFGLSLFSFLASADAKAQVKSKSSGKSISKIHAVAGALIVLLLILFPLLVIVAFHSW